MPFLVPQSGCASCSGSIVPVSVMTNVKRRGIEKAFRTARGLGHSNGSTVDSSDGWSMAFGEDKGVFRNALSGYDPALSVRGLRGLGDLSTLTADLSNGDWAAVFSDLLPVLAGGAAVWLVWHYVIKGHAAPASRPRRRRRAKAETSQSWF
jgi:hypothetical protein